MSNNNGGVNFVWVMDDKQKALCGCLTLIVILVIGGVLGYNYFFPSDENQVWDAKSAKSSLDNELSSLNTDVQQAENLVADKGVAAGDAKALSQTGDSISWATGMLKQAHGHLATLESCARHLKRSSDPAMRAEGVGFADHAAKAHAKLDEYTQRLQTTRDKLSKAVPREK